MSQREKPPLPAGSGAAMPSNAFDLMKQLRAAEKSDSAKVKSQTQANRLLKQELRRELIERKLMESEDYTHTEEGIRRELAYEDRINMEAEDVISGQIEKYHRDLKKNDFREKIRREAEERQRQEEIELERKRQVAEQRRQAVVDRIRRKKEEEERLVREAEEARMREIAEKERLVQEAAERLRADRAGMEMEDELSGLAEQLYAEWLEKEAWKKKEALRLAAWEEEQRQKDEEEAAKRKERLAELQAKKAKLAELRNKKKITTGKVDDPAASAAEREKDVATARAEALKLGKQMRIQNKAKFVSKKRSAGNNNTSPLSSTTKRPDTAGAEGNAVEDFAAVVTAQIAVPVKAVVVPSVVAEEIAEMTVEADLHQKLKSTMAEKRKLRLELMQVRTTCVAEGGQGGGVPVSSPDVVQLQQRVEEISAVEKLIEARIEDIVTKKMDMPKENMGSMGGKVCEGGDGEFSSLDAADEASGRTRKGSNAIYLGASVRFAETSGSSSIIRSAEDNLFCNIERSLQEAQEVLGKAVVVDNLSASLGERGRARNSSDEFALVTRKAGLLKMQMTDFLKKMEKRDDVIGYTDKLSRAVQKLTTFIESHQVAPLNRTLSRHNSLNRDILNQLPDQNSVPSKIGAPTPPKSKPPPRTASSENVMNRTGSRDNVMNRTATSSENVLKTPTAVGGGIALDFAALAKPTITPHTSSEKEAARGLPAAQTSHSSPRSGSFGLTADSFLSPSSRRSPRERLAEKQLLPSAPTPVQQGSADEPYIVSPRSRLSPRAKQDLDNMPADGSVGVSSSASKIPDKSSARVSGRSTSRSTAREGDVDENAMLSNFIAAETATGIEKSAQYNAGRRGSRSGVVQSLSAKKPEVEVATKTMQFRTRDAIEPQRQVLAGDVVKSTTHQHAVGHSQQDSNKAWSAVTTQRVILSVAGQGAESKKDRDIIDEPPVSVLVEEHQLQPASIGTPIVKKEQRDQAPYVSPVQTTNKEEAINNEQSGGGMAIASQLFPADVGGDDVGCRDSEDGGEGMVEGEEQDGQPAEDEAVDYDAIPGWSECLHTSMATAAHHAAFYGFSDVLDVLSRYFDVFAMDKNGRTPLFYAALRNNIDCVLVLVALDPLWIDVGDIRGDTAIHAAAISNGVEVLSFLLTCEVNPDTANYEGLTAAHLAKTEAALDALHLAGATMYCVDSHSRMPLWYSCKEGKAGSVSLLCGLTPQQYITWQDDDGNTPLHIACMSGHSAVVETICMWITKLEDFYICNKKSYSVAHVATTADVLKKLYEYGMDLWTCDSKWRYPLFINAFQGRVDCVALLIELACQNDPTLIAAQDVQGDSALHAACLCGHIQCVSLLLYFLRDVPNKQGILPHQLAMKAGHHAIANYVYQIDEQKEYGATSYDIFQCGFDNLAAVTLCYGSRWTKLYDVYNDAVYYYDRVTNASQWHRPDSYDENPKEETGTDKAREILKNFYTMYNPEKLVNINDILHMYKNNYQELFIQLADRYQVQDLSLFTGRLEE